MLAFKTPELYVSSLEPEKEVGPPSHPATPAGDLTLEASGPELPHSQVDTNTAAVTDSQNLEKTII